MKLSLLLHRYTYRDIVSERCFVGFVRHRSEVRITDRVWNSIVEALLPRFNEILGSAMVQEAVHLFCAAHPPIVVYGRSELVGISLLKVFDWDAIMADPIEKINRHVISTLFTLPMRTHRELDTQLLIELCKCGIYPEIRRLDKLCVKVVASAVPDRLFDQLPKLCQKEVEKYRSDIRRHKAISRNFIPPFAYCQFTQSRDRALDED